MVIKPQGGVCAPVCARLTGCARLWPRARASRQVSERRRRDERTGRWLEPPTGWETNRGKRDIDPGLKWTYWSPRWRHGAQLDVSHVVTSAHCWLLLIWFVRGILTCVVHVLHLTHTLRYLYFFTVLFYCVLIEQMYLWVLYSFS